MWDLRDWEGVGALFSPSDPSVRHWDRLFDSSPMKGEGDNAGWFGLVVGPAASPLWIADQVRNDVTRCVTWRFPTLWILP